MAVKNISGQAASQVSSTKVGELGSVKSTKNSDGVIGSQAKQAGNGNKGVDVAVSDKAKTRAAEQRLAKEIAMKSPEVREDRVASLKAQIDAGTYKIDSQKIADGMMREAVMEHMTKEGS